MATRTHGLLPIPTNQPALVAELGRLERELERVSDGPARRLLAIQRRRVLIRLAA